MERDFPLCIFIKFPFYVENIIYINLFTSCFLENWKAFFYKINFIFQSVKNATQQKNFLPFQLFFIAFFSLLLHHQICVCLIKKSTAKEMEKGKFSHKKITFHSILFLLFSHFCFLMTELMCFVFFGVCFGGTQHLI